MNKLQQSAPWNLLWNHMVFDLREGPSDYYFTGSCIGRISCGLIRFGRDHRMATGILAP